MLTLVFTFIYYHYFCNSSPAAQNFQPFFLQHGPTISNVFVSQLQQLNQLNTIYPSTPLCSSLNQLLILSFHLSAFVRILSLTDLTTHVSEPYVMKDFTSYINLFFDILCKPFTTNHRKITVECPVLQFL